MFKLEQDIYHFPGGEIPPGQYVFPFTFGLPQNCPSSAYFTGTDQAVAYVKYTCKGKFKAADDTNVKDIKYKCRLVVRQLAPSGAINITARKEAEIYKCC